MKTTPQVDQTAIRDKGTGYFTMIPNIVFKLGLSPQAGWAYCRLKCHAGADLKALPRQERRISRQIGISRPAWNRISHELQEAGLIRIEGDSLVLTDVMLINARHFAGKLSLEKAKTEIRRLGDTEAKQTKQPKQKDLFGPNSGQNLGPNSGQKSGPNSGHMINNMKNNNMRSSSSSQVPTMSAADKAQDDENKNLAQVVEWFEELSNGTRWNWHRDGKAYDQVKHLAPGFILMGICYSVARCPSHKLGTFGYCLPSIRDYAKTLRLDNDELMQLALRERKKTLKMARLGKWTVPEMTKKEFDSVMRESRAGD